MGIDFKQRDRGTKESSPVTLASAGSCTDFSRCVTGLVGVQTARIKPYAAANLRAVWTSTSTPADQVHSDALLEVQSAKIHRDTRADRYGALNSKRCRCVYSHAFELNTASPSFCQAADSQAGFDLKGLACGAAGYFGTPAFKSKSPAETLCRFGQGQGAFNSKTGLAGIPNKRQHAEL